MSNELKPCPFCRALEPQKIMFCDDLYGWIYRVQCVNCKAMVESLADMEKAIQQWNTRPAEDALKAEVERLKEALQDIADECQQARVYAIEILEMRFIDEVEAKARIALKANTPVTAEKGGDDE